MKEAVQLNIGGIKCDTDGCDYHDRTVKVEDYEQWIDRPCPKCGGNLLTKADYTNVKILQEVTGIVNLCAPEPNPDEPIVGMSVEMNGSGKMEFHLQNDPENKLQELYKGLIQNLRGGE